MKYRSFLDPASLAATAAGQVVTLADDEAKANAFHWHKAQPWLANVADELRDSECADVRGALDKLIGAPTDASAFAALCESIDRADPEVRARLVESVGEAHARSRVGYHLGARYADRTRRATCDRRPPMDPPGPDRAEDPVVRVIVPFRDREPSGARLANLLACLTALRDQGPDAPRYAVTVVETDEVPRWRHVLEPIADVYVFAEHAGRFNKSWTVNLGILESGPCDVLCVLDGDALVDRDFVARNARRFQQPALGAFMPFRDLLYLDEESSDWAATRRCVEGQPAVDLEQVRGFLGYRSPGVCVWLRRDVFDAINGMDERYEGWGGEDIDLILRLQLRTGFQIFEDPMLHLHHPVAPNLVDARGDSANKHLQPLTWRGDARIGARTKYARSGDA